jgi:dihydrofolate synthase/folylpolyglutamate synthase
VTRDEAMQFWFRRINYEQRPPQIGDLKLDRMRTLLHWLGDPQRRFRIVHVAGSKGKGSVSAMLANILQTEGFRVGLFTSPHLGDVSERVQVDQTPISPDELTTHLTEIRDVCAAHHRSNPGLEPELTFFEIGTAIGFLHFARRRCDFAVVEVGLGGRFDTTNVCTPLLSIITSISFDHMQFLGNTLAEIAMEKAGIVKPGRPCVSGVRGDEARAVIAATCRERHSPLLQIDVDFHGVAEPARFDGAAERWPTVAVRTKARAWPALKLNLIGEHQASNAAVVVVAVEELRRLGTPISDRAVRDGLAEVRWPARMEIVGRQPLILLDGAHNLASAEAVVRTLTESFPLHGERWLVFAGSRDKDLVGMLAVLAPAFDRIVLTRFLNNPRALPAEQLRAMVPPEKRAACLLTETPQEAVQAIRAHCRPNDQVLACGSLFLVGELRPLLVPSSDTPPPNS